MDHIFEAIHRWRIVVPTARRVIAAHWDHFLADAPALRIGLAKGKYDAHLPLSPRRCSPGGAGRTDASSA